MNCLSRLLAFFLAGALASHAAHLPRELGDATGLSDTQLRDILQTSVVRSLSAPASTCAEGNTTVAFPSPTPPKPFDLLKRNAFVKRYVIRIKSRKIDVMIYSQGGNAVDATRRAISYCRRQHLLAWIGRECNVSCVYAFASFILTWYQTSPDPSYPSKRRVVEIFGVVSVSTSLLFLSLLVLLIIRNCRQCEEPLSEGILSEFHLEMRWASSHPWMSSMKMRMSRLILLLLWRECMESKWYLRPARDVLGTLICLTAASDTAGG
jgi:hypothetical protein